MFFFSFKPFILEFYLERDICVGQTDMSDLSVRAHELLGPFGLLKQFSKKVLF